MKNAFCIIQLQCAQMYGLVFTANPQNDKYAHWLVTVKLKWDKVSSDNSVLLKVACLTGTDV